LADHPGHALWKRDFTGACGLFSMVLRTSSPQDVAAFVDNLQYFGLGVSWGGYESLVVRFTPGASHTGARWPWRGQALRLHVGLEDADDLIADLAQALAHMTQQRASSRRLSPA